MVNHHKDKQTHLKVPECERDKFPVRLIKTKTSHKGHPRQLALDFVTTTPQ